MKYKCTVSYVGKKYCGWQSQTKGDSIQETIEEAIQNITQEKINIVASGRTDAGVNASHQVFMFETNKEMDPYKWQGAINRFLPDDIHILDCEEVDDLFHSRYQVRYKTYTYRINNGPYDVFSKDYAYQYNVPLDIQKMKECIQVFVGKHDFTSFNSSSFEEYPIQEREIYKADISKQGNMILITFTGKGFLRYQVRMMCAALIDVGRGKSTTQQIKDILEAKSREVIRHNAPASGLTLEEVNYFEMIALNENIQIREFLRSDTLPFDKDIKELEDDIKNDSRPIYYAITSRHEQILKGYLEITNDDAIVHLFDMNDEMYIKEVDEQLKQKLTDKGISSYRVVHKKAVK